MPKYKTFKYGKIGKYGRYDLRGVKGSVGPYQRYRVRTIGADGNRSEYVTLIEDRIYINGRMRSFRLRAANEEWVYMNQVDVNGKAERFRIRSLESDGGYSEWVEYEEANLKER